MIGYLCDIILCLDTLMIKWSWSHLLPVFSISLCESNFFELRTLILIVMSMTLQKMKESANWIAYPWIKIQKDEFLYGKLVFCSLV